MQPKRVTSRAELTACSERTWRAVEVVLDSVDSVAGQEVGEGGTDFAHERVALRDQGHDRGDHEQRRKEAEDRRVCCRPGERQHIVRERVQRGAPQLLEWTQHS